MNVFGTIVKGAASQFGREFGRAGANSVLKGSNHYTIKNGNAFIEKRRTKTELEKEIINIKFGTTDANNIRKLVQLQVIVNKSMKEAALFDSEVVNNMDYYVTIFNLWIDKNKLGQSLMSDLSGNEMIEKYTNLYSENVDLYKTFVNKLEEHNQLISDKLKHKKKVAYKLGFLGLLFPLSFILITIFSTVFSLDIDQVIVPLVLLSMLTSGLYNFYIGRIGRGLLFTFTGGLYGVGVIYDLIRLDKIVEERFYY